MFSTLSVLLNHCWILVLAVLLFINLSQSLLGPFDLSEVKISTISPFFSFVTIGIILLLILQPVIRFPISSCMLYAKSIGVAPLGNTWILPFGVNTYTSSSNNSVFKVFKNSWGSSISFCHSSVSLSQDNLSSLTVTFAFFPPKKLASLYAQCAAIPYSAILCISQVRICTSKGVPFGPINVVCKDWYMLGFGTEI